MSLSLMGCASLKPSSKEQSALYQPAERGETMESSAVYPIPPENKFYLSTYKSSRQEPFLRSDMHEEENSTSEEELAELWESGVSEDTVKFFEESIQFDLSEANSTDSEESESDHLHGMKPYYSAFHLVSLPKHESTPTNATRIRPPAVLTALPKDSGPDLLFTPPLTNAYILRGVNPNCWRGRGHCGVDMVSPKGKGEKVRVVEDGIVLAAGKRKQYGHYAVVLHKGGIVSLYSHALEDPDVEPCQSVKKQDVIAKVGSSGNAKGPHLHFEMIDLDKGWQGKKNLDKVVAQMCNGGKKKSKVKEAIASIKDFESLFFRKDLKLNPLDYIPGIASNRSKFRMGNQRAQAKSR
jgi:murein DD-endopeptidase MepM/ murein hydrolase activator NlpD